MSNAVSFMTKVSVPIHSTLSSSLRWVPSLGLALLSTDWLGVCMGQKSRYRFLPWPGFEPRTSHLAVQRATTRPPRRTEVFSGNKIDSKAKKMLAIDWCWPFLCDQLPAMKTHLLQTNIFYCLQGTVWCWGLWIASLVAYCSSSLVFYSP